MNQIWTPNFGDNSKDRFQKNIFIFSKIVLVKLNLIQKLIKTFFTAPL